MYLIQNGIVHIGDGSVLESCDILIRDGKIQKIGKGLQEEAEVIDATDCHVFPGFIDPNSAIGAMGIPTRYLDNNEITDPISPEMKVKYSVDPDEINAQEFYKSGITTIGFAPGNVNVMGGQIAVFKTAPQKVEQRIVKECAALKCSVESGVKEAYGTEKKIPMTKMGCFHMLTEAIRGARAEVPDKRTEKQTIISQVFDQKSMPVFIAASEKSEMDGVLHLFQNEEVTWNFVDGFSFTDCMEELKKQKPGLILGNVNSCAQITRHDMNMACLKELNENGNLIAFTNTCKGASEGREVFLWSAIEVYRGGVPAEEVVKMMCQNPAKMLGIEGRVGTLEEGKDADLSIFTGHPVTTYAAAVKHSIINGEVIF